MGKSVFKGKVLTQVGSPPEEEEERGGRVKTGSYKMKFGG